ncbi:DnaJ domain protein [Paramagnetospirillum magnetotacticum MS-1]|uniref:DnaJ domain protein n=1 Tax=Paramagnetospirillum magnetotacticum MS-1 TaxID=272627 RepID=A0A0C2YC45_PARME|nr:DnaJ domain-containing protein [Paramagnetospirillum magnetotacticum]KIL97324.1 DnaJ domain protein [Paramagnetospirillum magnetotacticum MS-1]
MILRLLLLVGGGFALWWGWHWWRKASPDKARKALIAAVLAALVLGGILLVVTGKLAGLAAIAAGLSPWIGRALRLHQMWQSVKRMTGRDAPSGQTPPPPPQPPADTAMSRAQAYEVLGIPPGASPEEIQEAHRRLMRSAHPDAGGSTWIAARLNQARDVLLG